MFAAKFTYDDEPTDQNEESLNKAMAKAATAEQNYREAWMMSPERVKELRQEASESAARNDFDYSIALTRQADEIEELREKLIARSKEATAARNSVVGVLKEAQEEAEVPQAFRRQWIGHEYTDDDLVESALDRAENNRNKYDVDASYEIDAENDRIVFTAEWTLNEYGTEGALEDDDGVHQSLLRTGGYRPSPEQAREIAQQLNADYLENAGQPSWHEDEDETRARWRESVTQNLVANVAADDEVLAARIRSNVVFNETLAQGGPYSEGTIMETWDEYFGDDDD